LPAITHKRSPDRIDGHGDLDLEVPLFVGQHRSPFSPRRYHRIFKRLARHVVDDLSFYDGLSDARMENEQQAHAQQTPYKNIHEWIFDVKTMFLLCKEHRLPGRREKRRDIFLRLFIEMTGRRSMMKYRY